jgi:glycosyltransferase involved in cell wall biosynthesis
MKVGRPREGVRPSISVVIPHYNHSAYLRDCLQGLCDQTDIPDEVVLVDDRSDDVEAVKAVVAEFEGKLNLHAVYSKEKLYCGGARQLGAEQAGGDILVMHDADDLSHRQRIEFTRTFFSDYPDAVQMNTGFMVTNALPLGFIRDFSKQELRASIVPPAEIVRALRGVYTRNRFTQGRRPSLHTGSYGSAARFGCCAGHVAYRREVVPIVRWTSPRHYLVTKFEDYEFNLLLFLTSLRSYQVDLPLLYYRAGTTTNKL